MSTKVRKTVAAAHQENIGKVEDTTAKKLVREKTLALVAKASEKTHETAVKNIAGLKVSINNSLDNISNYLAEEITNLKTVQEAIRAEEHNLAQLHNITKEADTLQALILANETERREFEETIAGLRTAWKIEADAHQKAKQERDNEVAKVRSWEQETYQYNLQKTRQTEQDEYKANHAKDVKSWSDYVEGQNNGLKAREAAVTAKEDEYKALHARIAQADETTKTEISRAVAIATSALKKDLTHSFEVEKLQINNSYALKQAEVATLTARIKELQEQNAALATKYQEASDKVQQIAEKAIEGASKQSVIVQTPSSENGDNRRK